MQLGMSGNSRQKIRHSKKEREPVCSFRIRAVNARRCGHDCAPERLAFSRATKIAKSHGAQLIADERHDRLLAGWQWSAASAAATASRNLFVRPAKTKMCSRTLWPLAKGLTGGYMPMAATLTTQKVFDAFLGEYEEFKTFFHGHSFTGKPTYAPLPRWYKSMDLAAGFPRSSKKQRSDLEQNLRAALQTLWDLPQVGDIRQVGLVAGIELVRNWKTREPYELRERAGIGCLRRHGQTRRPHAPHWQRHRHHAPVLHNL